MNSLLHNTLVRQELPVLLLPGVSVNKELTNTHEVKFLSLRRPELLLSPPLEHWKVSLLQVAALTSRSHVPTSKMRPSLALGNDVVNRHLAVPLATVRACRLL